MEFGCTSQAFSCPAVSVGFPGGLLANIPSAHAGDEGSIPGWGRSPGEGLGNLLQNPRLQNPMDGGAWRAPVHGVTESDTTE